MAREVLVTGATGTLGHRVVGEATEAGHNVRALSRKSHVGYTGVHWAQGDLLSGEGIEAALDGIDTVIHCATQGTRAKDLVSATNLISAARRAKTANIIYVSIAGIDRIPLPYYKTKLRVEEALTASGLGHTIVRVTQFHDLIKTTFSAQRFSPAVFAIKGVRFQPIDTRDVADPSRIADRQRTRRSRRRHRRACGPRSRRTRPQVPDVDRQPSTGGFVASTRWHRRRFQDRRQPGAGKPDRENRLRPVSGCNYMTFLCLSPASS